MKQFTDLVARVHAAPAIARARAARRIEAVLRQDATSRIGRVPDGIRVSVVGDRIDVRGPDWVLAKAAEKGQHAKWMAIVGEEVRRALREAKG